VTASHNGPLRHMNALSSIPHLVFGCHCQLLIDEYFTIGVNFEQLSGWLHP